MTAAPEETEARGERTSTPRRGAPLESTPGPGGVRAQDVGEALLPEVSRWTHDSKSRALVTAVLNAPEREEKAWDFPERDVQDVMEQARVSLEEAKHLLAESGGVVAEAVLDYLVRVPPLPNYEKELLGKGRAPGRGRTFFMAAVTPGSTWVWRYATPAPAAPSIVKACLSHAAARRARGLRFVPPHSELAELLAREITERQQRETVPRDVLAALGWIQFFVGWLRDTTDRLRPKYIERLLSAEGTQREHPREGAGRIQLKALWLRASTLYSGELAGEIDELWDRELSHLPPAASDTWVRRADPRQGYVPIDDLTDPRATTGEDEAISVARKEQARRDREYGSPHGRVNSDFRYARDFLKELRRDAREGLRAKEKKEELIRRLTAEFLPRAPEGRDEAWVREKILEAMRLAGRRDRI